MKNSIVSVKAREILDSRAIPTVECEVVLEDGSRGTASVPSGASTGIHEAIELRDKDSARYMHKGVKSAVKNVNETIADAIVGLNAYDQANIDYTMISQDGTNNKSNLGANAILSVSEAVADAAANSLNIPLYRYLGGISAPRRMPYPMMNVLNGGAHAKNNIDIQEFMIIPRSGGTFSDGVRMCVEVYHKLKAILAEKSLSTAVGDEGGFAPNLESDESALALLCESVEKAGYKVGDDFSFALDVAASEWHSDGVYKLPKRGVKYTAPQLCEYIAMLCDKYPIISVEDGVGEDDFSAWRILTDKLSPRGINTVGDDLFVTNTERLKKGIKEKIANTVLVKPNQIGSVTEAVECVNIARSAGYKSIMSHRSGETESTFIADLAVALGTEYVKFGAPCRSERTAKYNRLMKIESELFAR